VVATSAGDETGESSGGHYRAAAGSGLRTREDHPPAHGPARTGNEHLQLSHGQRAGGAAASLPDVMLHELLASSVGVRPGGYHWFRFSAAHH